MLRRISFSLEENLMCGKHKGPGPLKIGAIIVSSHAICVGCPKFEECFEPPAILARIALELSAREAVNRSRRHERVQKAFNFMN